MSLPLKVFSAFALAALLAVVTVSFSEALESYRIKNGMIYWLPDIDQNTMHTSSGNLFGLKNKKGKAILPPEYSDIEYCGHGLFLATDVQKQNKYYFGENRYFFNRDGDELKYKIPENSLLLNIFSFGKKADADTELVLKRFSTDTILLFGDRNDKKPIQASNYQGLCDIKGRVLLQPLRGHILFLKPGFAFVIRDGGKKSIVNLETWEEEPTTLSRNPGTVPPSRIKWPSNHQVPMPFPGDRIKEIVKTDSGKFDHQYWCERRDSPIRGIEMFGRFLNDYNLIAMPQSEVKALLGEPRQLDNKFDSLVYTFPSRSCVGAYEGFRINLKNDKVSDWCFVTCDGFNDKVKDSNPITTNVIFSRARGFFGHNMEPKISK